jgi:hypothetical protein
MKGYVKEYLGILPMGMPPRDINRESYRDAPSDKEIKVKKSMARVSLPDREVSVPTEWG